MRSTTLVAAVFASTAIAAPTSLTPEKRMEKCGQFTEDRFLKDGATTAPLYPIEGNGQCQNLGNTDTWFFELFSHCASCTFYFGSDCNTLDSPVSRPAGDYAYWNFRWIGAKSFQCA